VTTADAEPRHIGAQFPATHTTPDDDVGVASEEVAH
jgi:hypothetical protein